MMPRGNEDKFKIFVGDLQCVYDLHGTTRIDIVIHTAGDELQRAGESVSVGYVGLLGVPGTDGPTHPLLIPPDFIHAIVMTTAVGGRDFIKITESDESPHCTLTAGGRAVDSHA